MIQKSRIWKEFEALPPDAQRQVAAFIAFLRTRSEEHPAERAGAQVPLRHEHFVGLWAERENLADNTAWVRRLRESEWPAG